MTTTTMPPITFARSLFAGLLLCAAGTACDDGSDEFADGDDTLRAADSCGDSTPSASKWRIRNASAQDNSGQWVLREMDFCIDADCSEVLSGTAIDSGNAMNWAPAANAFDDNTSTMWKTTDAGIAGQSWIGLELDAPASVGGIYLKTDNVVYSVDTIFVEYYDDDSQAWVTADYLTDVPSGSELEYAVTARERFPVSWRVRNASAQGNSGQWVLREMDFCADAACTEVLDGGTAIDSGSAMNWAPAQNAFDDNTSTMWKTTDAGIAGQSYIGMEFGEITEIGGVYLKTDNVVYSVDSVYVEYFDIIEGSWVTADVLGNLPAATEQTLAVEVRERFPVSWRVRNASAQGNSGQWVLREMDFCADAACTEVLNGGTAIDSGSAMNWAPAQNAFDDNTSTMWKTTDAGTAGESYIGMEFGEVTEIGGLFLKTDNVVYSVDSVYVEYFDFIEDAWVTADILSNLPSSTEQTLAVEVRDRFPISWRIRNAEAQGNSGQWVLREMDFCADADCSEALNGGTAIDSGSAMNWAPAQNAFDDDTSTMWKTTDAGTAGQSYIGMEFDELTEIAGLYVKTDNVVYSVGAIDVEYYDALDEAWIAAESLTDVPASSELTYAIDSCE